MTPKLALNGAKCDYVREYLAELLEKLDELDDEDYFGTEGWRRMLSMETD